MTVKGLTTHRSGRQSFPVRQFLLRRIIFFSYFSHRASAHSAHFILIRRYGLPSVPRKKSGEANLKRTERHRGGHAGEKAIEAADGLRVCRLRKSGLVFVRGLACPTMGKLIANDLCKRWNARQPASLFLSRVPPFFYATSRQETGGSSLSAVRSPD